MRGDPHTGADGESVGSWDHGQLRIAARGIEERFPGRRGWADLAGRRCYEQEAPIADIRDAARPEDR